MTVPENRFNRRLRAHCLVGILLFAAHGLARADDTVSPTGAALPVATDILAAQDKPGVYTLTWRKLPPLIVSKPTVWVGEKRLPDDAYTWDAEKGTITFTDPLKTGMMARVAYRYDAKLSEHNASPASAPVTVPLLREGGTQLQLSALPAGTFAGAGGDPTLVWKLGVAPVRAFGGSLHTSAMFAPGASAGNGNASGAWDRSNVSLGYTLGSDKNGISADWSRGGRAFAPAVGKAFGQSGAAGETRSLLARYGIAPWLRAEWRQDSTALLAANAGNTATQKASVLLGGIANLPTLNLTRTEEAKRGGNGVTDAKTTDRVELGAKLGAQTALAGSAQTVGDVVGGKPGDKQTDLSVSLQAQNKTNTQKAAVALTETTTVRANGSDSDRTAVTLQVQASPAITLSAGQKTEETTTPGKGGDKTVATGQTDAQAKFALAPGASLSGGVSVRSVNDGAANTSGTLQGTSVSAKIGEGKAVEMSQSVVSRAGSMPGVNTVDTVESRLSLRPAPGWTLSGALLNNPEKDGQVAEGRREEMGLAAKIGDFQFGGNYALSAAPSQRGVQTGELSLTLAMRLDRYTKVSGQFKDALAYGITEQTAGIARGLRTYSLGLTRDLGAAFNFSLGGGMTSDKTPGGAPEDYHAEAKVGAKF